MVFLRVLSDTMTLEDYKNCARCPYLISSIQPFSPIQDGYLIFKNFKSSLKTPKDSLIHDTKQFYALTIPTVDLLVEMLKEDVASNLNDWRDHQVWYADWVTGKKTEALYQYMNHDPTYRNKVANFYLLLYKNYLRGLSAYSEQASKLADQWEAEIGESEE